MAMMTKTTVFDASGRTHFGQSSYAKSEAGDNGPRIEPMPPITTTAKTR
jgi:hypothetical protein